MDEKTIILGTLAIVVVMNIVSFALMGYDNLPLNPQIFPRVDPIITLRLPKRKQHLGEQYA